ncbi:MAG: zinc-dependent metalloprotease [Myxococcales bacterium]
MDRTHSKASKNLTVTNRISREDSPMSNSMAHRILRVVAVAAAFQATASCVQTRPARNAVLNEHQYVRKDFLVAPANSTTPDPGWWLKGTIVQVSTPNPLGSAFELSPGIDSGAVPVRFVITEDKLQMVSTREEAGSGAANVVGSGPDAQSPQVTPAVVNAWPSQSVDLMYYVNLDGEITNQYVVNQEAPWQQREWVQLDFDKNDMSDLQPLGEYQWNLLSHCVDTGNVSTTLVPNSFYVDTANNYMQWTVSVTLPLIWDDPNCTFAYGDLGQNAASLGKESVTLNLMYSLERQKGLPNADGSCSAPFGCTTYKPLTISEKDGIQHKYGFLQNITQNLDPNTQQLAMQQQVVRFDPEKPIVWYFAQGFPDAYKHYFTDPNTGIMDRTNTVLAASGAPARVVVKNYDEDLAPGQQPRQYGDIRYNFFVWMSDQFSQDSFAGVTIQDFDYRTGEAMAANIAFNDFAFQDYYVQRIDAYLQSIGAYGTDASGNNYNVNTPGEWPTTPTVAEAPGITDPSQDPRLANCSAASSAGTCPITVQLGIAPNTTTKSYYCTAGSTLPIESAVDAAIHNGTSTVYGKMQGYLGKPTATSGPLGPQDFIAWPSKNNDADFFNAYYALLPYITYADPAMNPYVIPEGGNGTFGPPTSDAYDLLSEEVQFQQAAANLAAGSGNGWPYQGANGTPTWMEAATGADNFRQLTQYHHDYQYNLKTQSLKRGVHLDAIDSLAFENVADDVARTCGSDTQGAWQTKEQWTADVANAYWAQVFIHEFGHSLGLQHNFMGSVDAPHYPAYAIGSTQQSTCDQNPTATGCVPVLHSSSVMEYNSEIDRLRFTEPGSQGANGPWIEADWGPYDKGAIAWIYANNSPDGTPPGGAPCITTGCSISGQNSPTSPWNDPMGFDSSGNEKRFLFCDEYHMKYTPLCREGDLGRTPSEITANELDSYEWQYQWRNQRSYHKFWDDSLYANQPEGLFYDLTKFVSMWAFDWSNTELQVTLFRIGVPNPSPTTQSNSDYYAQLSNKFEAEVSASGQMAAAYHIAMINQAQSERPAATTYDPFYGDVEVQGIILDKYFAMQNFAGLWPVMNYDPTQSAGAYLSWYSGIGDEPFNSLTQWGVTTMLGAIPNVFPYFQPTTVALFAQDTHNPAFNPADPYQRNWIGGHSFIREQDFLSYFQNIAVQNQYTGAAGCATPDPTTGGCNCLTTQTCTYDPRLIPDPLFENQFVGPDGRHYIWSYLQDSNTWVIAEQDTNIATNYIMLQYNGDVVAQQDDGNFPGGAFLDELPIKYTIDAFNYYNQ